MGPADTSDAEVIVDANPILATEHNNQCESCCIECDTSNSFILSCDLCNRKWHFSCYRPSFICRPSYFNCCFCAAGGKTATSERIREKALLYTKEILLLKANAQERLGCENNHNVPISPPDDNTHLSISLPAFGPYNQQHESQPVTDLATPLTQMATLSSAITTAANCNEEELPATSMRQIEGFIKTIHKHEHNEQAIGAILQVLSEDKVVHQQLKVGLQNLSLNEASTPTTTINDAPPIILPAISCSEGDEYYPLDDDAFRHYVSGGIIIDGQNINAPGKRNVPAEGLEK